MEKIATEKVIRNNRKALSFVGRNFGFQYYRPEARANVLEFEKKKRDVEANGNLDLITNRATNRYVVKGFDTESIEVGTDVTGNPVVIINKDSDSEVMLPISSDLSKVGVVSEDAIGRAIRGEKNIIFSDVEKLVAAANNANRLEINRIDSLINALNREKKSLNSAISDNEKKRDDYLHELQESEIPEDASITVTVTED